MGLKRHDSMALLLVLLLPVCTRSTRRLPVAVSPTRTVSLEWPAAAASRASKVLVARAFADRWRLSSGGGCDAPTCVAEALADAMEAAEADEARVVSGARSQAGQDAWVLNLMGGRPGYFVEAGAHDGVTHSNTAALERDHGWRGLCVERCGSRAGAGTATTSRRRRGAPEI
jgi:hypothetical protein